MMRNRRVRWMSALGALFLFAGIARADLKIGVVDLNRTLEGFDRYRTRAEALENRKKELQEIVDRQEEEVVRLMDELDRLGSGDEASSRRSEIEDRDRVLRDFVQRTNRKFREELQALQARTRDEIETGVSRVAEANDIDFVVEKNLALFVRPNLDITERLLTRLNLLFPIETTSPPPLWDVEVPDFPPPSSSGGDAGPALPLRSSEPAAPSTRRER